MKERILVSILAVLSITLNVIGQTRSGKDDNVVVQMNYCINSLTNIIHNKSNIIKY